MAVVSKGSPSIPGELLSGLVSVGILEETPTAHPIPDLLDRFQIIRGQGSASTEGGSRRLFVQLSDYTSSIKNASFVSGNGTSLITNQPIGLSLIRPPQHFSPLTLGLFLSVNPS
ncbi:MAG: hypothetical protein U1F57_00515 [bacterium]